MGKKDTKNTLAATALVELMRDLIQQENLKRDATDTCCVRACNPDGTYDITVLPDTETVVKSVKSISPDNIRPGDYVYIFKFANKLNNAIIISKIGGQGSDTRFVTSGSSGEDYNAVLQSLGTAATKDVGLSPGNVPIIGSDGFLDPSIIPGGGGGDNKYVRYDINTQGLDDTQKANARTNIGAGNISGSIATSNYVVTTNGNNSIKSSSYIIAQSAHWDSTSDITLATMKGVADYVSTQGYGTVTSVGLDLPTTVFNITVSPITTSGTLTATLKTQNANLVFAGPVSGNAAAPTFRALQSADIPDLKSIYVPYTGATADVDLYGDGTSPHGLVAATVTAKAKIYSSTANNVYTSLQSDAILAQGTILPNQSGGAVYRFPFDEGLGEFVLATRSWVQNTAKAHDADLLDGYNSTYYLNYNNLTNKPSIPSKDSDLTNDRYVRYDTASQGLTPTQKTNARTNIGVINVQIDDLTGL